MTKALEDQMTTDTRRSRSDLGAAMHRTLTAGRTVGDDGEQHTGMAAELGCPHWTCATPTG